MAEQRYATGTSVPVEKTRAEIENLLRKHQASAFASAWDANSSAVQFEIRVLGAKLLPDLDKQVHRGPLQLLSGGAS